MAHAPKSISALQRRFFGIKFSRFQHRQFCNNRGVTMIVRPYANVLLGLSIAFGLSCSLFASDAKLGENLRTHLADKSIKQADILIYLKSQADLSGAKSLKSKAEKGRFVVNALQQTAKTSQQSILKKPSTFTPSPSTAFSRSQVRCQSFINSPARQVVTMSV